MRQRMLLAARNAMRGRKRILMLEDRIPKESLGAGYPRSRQLAHDLVAAGVDLTFYPMFRREERWPDIRTTLGATVETFRWGSAEQLRPFLESRKGHYDAFLVCRPHNMKAFLDALGTEPRPDRRRQDYLRRRGGIRAARHSATRARWRTDGPTGGGRRYRGGSRSDAVADAVISVSEAEQHLFETHGVTPCFWLGHSITPHPGPASFADRRNILFIGAIHDENAPNADAVRWFASDILPPLRKCAWLGCPFAGRWASTMRRPIAALGGSVLDLLGPWTIWQPCFNQARICVVPSRLAAGHPAKASRRSSARRSHRRDRVDLDAGRLAGRPRLARRFRCRGLCRRCGSTLPRSRPVGDIARERSEAL